MPQRSLLCLKRNVDESGAWAFGKEFIAIIRDQGLPGIPGREGAMFSIYWGQVSADSDGPVEWCKPVPAAEAEELAAQIPELTLRVEPAHREAYVELGRPEAAVADAGGSRRADYLPRQPAAEREERPGLRLRGAIRLTRAGGRQLERESYAS
jgi:hypothetical protein